jgi:hypothetical protein|tara:strand:+ start:7925 stop:8707 length:783 start_codon:yes stop_codon:yes gene_type:complete
MRPGPLDGFPAVKGPRVFVSLVKYDKTEDLTETCIGRMLSLLNRRGIDFVYDKTSSSGFLAARNRAVDSAREYECTHLLIVDDDMVFEEDAALRLLNWKLPIVSATYIMNRDPYIPNVRRRAGSDWDYDQDGLWFDMEASRHQQIPLLEVDSTGAGFILIDMRVFDLLEKPYYFMAVNPDDPTSFMGEDTYFMFKCRDVGIPVVLDCGLEVGHIGTFTYTMDNFRAYWSRSASGAVDERDRADDDMGEGDGTLYVVGKGN